MVILGNTYSASWPYSMGIYPFPLFNIYMKSLGEIIQGFGVGCHNMQMTPNTIASCHSTLKKLWTSWDAVCMLLGAR